MTEAEIKRLHVVLSPVCAGKERDFMFGVFPPAFFTVLDGQTSFFDAQVNLPPNWVIQKAYFGASTFKQDKSQPFCLSFIGNGFELKNSGNLIKIEINGDELNTKLKKGCDAVLLEVVTDTGDVRFIRFGLVYYGLWAVHSVQYGMRDAQAFLWQDCGANKGLRN